MHRCHRSSPTVLLNYAAQWGLFDSERYPHIISLGTNIYTSPPTSIFLSGTMNFSNLSKLILGTGLNRGRDRYYNTHTLRCLFGKQKEEEEFKQTSLP